MSIGLLFWIIWIVALLFGAYGVYRTPVENRFVAGGSLLFFVLTGLLAYAVFGGPIKN